MYGYVTIILIIKMTLFINSADPGQSSKDVDRLMTYEGSSFDCVGVEYL